MCISLRDLSSLFRIRTVNVVRSDHSVNGRASLADI
jgi:hypothetical protein